MCLHMNLLRLCTAVVFSASVGSHNPKLPIIPHVVCLFTCKRRAECMKQDIKFQMDLLHLMAGGARHTESSTVSLFVSDCAQAQPRKPVFT